MKRTILSSVLIALCLVTLAQFPESFNYQVVVREGTNPLTNQNVSFRMSILKGSISGESQYSELHSANTGALGIVNLVIGNGTGKTGNITTIDWGADTYFLKVEIDKTGGSSYVEMGTTQLLSVPYAMYAKTVETITETDPVFTSWDKNYADLINKPTAISDFSMNANSQIITNLADPTDNQDAATKAYVDALLSRIEALEGVNRFTDTRDGSHYNFVEIGNQVWMVENLKYLPVVHSNAEFATQGNSSLPGYGVYGYNGNDVATAKVQANYIIYGVLYNWYAVNSVNICPEGWHVPSDQEWTTLENFLIANGYNYDGTTTGNKYAKSLASTSGWYVSSTTGAVGNTDYPLNRNTTGLTAFPGGLRYDYGTYDGIGSYGDWWSSTESSTTYAWFRGMNYGNSSVGRSFLDKKYGFSVRCLRD